MNERLFDGILSATGVIGAVDTVLNFLSLENVSSEQAVGFLLLRIMVLCLILLCFFLYKRKFLHLYDILNHMIEENLLHPVRAMVVLTRDRLHRCQNVVTVEEAEFTYKLQASSRCKAEKQLVDVTYTIRLKLKWPRWRRANLKNRKLNFYIICGEVDEEQTESAEDETACVVKDMNVQIDQKEEITYTLEPIGDGAMPNAHLIVLGLYRMTIVPSRDMVKKRRVKLVISYKVENNILQNHTEHTFVVFPSNYGRKVKCLSFQIEVNEINLKYLALKQINYRGGTNTIGSFQKRGTSYTLLNEEKIKPKMETVYIVSFQI